MSEQRRRLYAPSELERKNFQADRSARKIADAIGILHYLAVHVIAVLGELTTLFKFVDTPQRHGLVFALRTIDFPVYAFTRVVPMGGGSFWLDIVVAQLTFVPATLIYWFISYMIIRLLLAISG